MENKKEIAPILPVNNLTNSILNALEQADKMQLSIAINSFKLPNGAINYPAILSVPGTDRIPSLVGKIGYERLHKTLGAAIQLAMESMNLSKPITANQIFDLVDAIIDTSSEDYLAIEDVILFLQKMVRGETGTLFSAMDIPKFMQMFEKYRQERHSELLRIREEKVTNWRDLGSGGGKTTIERDKNIDPATFFELMQTYQSGRSENME